VTPNWTVLNKQWGGLLSCVVAAKRGELSSAMLASWYPKPASSPGVTVAAAKDRAIEPLIHTGDKFVLNILQEGMNLRRHFLKPLLQEKTALLV